jgi:hypothetical protein
LFGVTGVVSCGGELAAGFGVAVGATGAGTGIRVGFVGGTGEFSCGGELAAGFGVT